MTATDAPLQQAPIGTVAIVPRSASITALGRKCYNALLFEAQAQSLEQPTFRAPLIRVMRGINVDSNQHALVKKHLRAMVSTTVEWHSRNAEQGSGWNASSLLAHARLIKERGQMWLEWSYAINLRQELLQPNGFGGLRLEIISQLRTHAAVALYEICSRDKDAGQTAQQPWRWWQPVLTGKPVSARSEKQEYRFFKRDTLKPAVAELNALTDLEVTLVEHKQGRFIDRIQFEIRPKPKASFTQQLTPNPVDLGTVKQESLSISEGAMKAKTVAAKQAAAAAAPTVAHSHEANHPNTRSHARRLAAWINRRDAQLAADITRLPMDTQHQLVQQLLDDMDGRKVHPAIRRRLTSSGWQHPIVRAEMIRFYGRAMHGDAWDRPNDEQLLASAANVPGSPPPSR